MNTSVLRDPRLRLPAALIAGILIILGGYAASHSRRDALLLAQHDAANARTAAAAAMASVSAADSVATAERLNAAHAEQARDSLLRELTQRERTANNLQGQFQHAASTAPDTCAAVVAKATETIAGKDSVIASLRAAQTQTQHASDSYHAGLDTIQPAARALTTATVTLSTATKTLEHASRPSFLARIAPRFGTGVAAGVDAFGRPNAVFGVTLGWSF